MNRTFNPGIVAAVLAVGALGAAAGANAATSVHVSVGLGSNRPAPVESQTMHGPATRPVHMRSHGDHDFPNSHGHDRRHVYETSSYDDEARYVYEHAGRNRCGAPRWHPKARYMPGEVVWRHGDLFVARGISARVYNENSPPEWTPRYWAPAVCR